MLSTRGGYRPATGIILGTAASLIVAALIAATVASVAHADDPHRIQPYPANPYYWSYQGEPRLLLGASRTHNLFQSTDIESELDDILTFGGNYVRNTLSFREDGDLFPYAGSSGRFDLTEFNPAYWQKLDDLLRHAKDREIIVQIEIWDIWDFQLEAWERNPFNPRNNDLPGIRELLPATLDEHASSRTNPFFDSVLDREHQAPLLELQIEFVRKLLSISLKYPNVLYCIDNESFVSAEWARFWAELIRTEAAARDTRVEITEMWEPWDIRAPEHLRTIDDPDTYSYIEASQNNHNSGQQHFDGAVYVRERTAAHPRPINNTKIYGSDTGTFVDADTAISSFWKNLFAGHAAVRFHREPSGIGTTERARSSIRVARRVFGEFDLLRARDCTGELAERQDDDVYCLRTDDALLLYFPKRKVDSEQGAWRALDRRFNLSRFIVDDAEAVLPDPAAFATARWYDIETAEIREEDVSGDERHVSPPDNEHWLLLLR